MFVWRGLEDSSFLQTLPYVQDCAATYSKDNYKDQQYAHELPEDLILLVGISHYIL